MYGFPPIVLIAFGGKQKIEYELKGKNISKMEFNQFANILYMELDGSDSGEMTIKLPRTLMDDNPVTQDKTYENWPHTEITEQKINGFRLLSFSIPYDSPSLSLYHKKIVDFDDDYGLVFTYSPEQFIGVNRDMEVHAVTVSNAELANVPKIQDAMEISLTFADRMENEFIEIHEIQNTIGKYRAIQSGPVTFVLQSYMDEPREFNFYQQWAYDSLKPVSIYDKPDHFFIHYKGEVFELKFENLDLELYD